MAGPRTLSDGERRTAHALFEQAIERVDASAWVREQPVPDGVKAEALSLLDYHSRAGSFLSAPPAALLADLLGEADPILPGTRLGPYVVERELGRGGMGCVYLASDTRLNRPVALKMIRPDLARSDAERDRLRREGRAAAQLSHPGICTVYALEELGDDLFIASEFVDGETLRAEIASRLLPSAAAVADLAREVAGALAAAHERGIVHGDLKPENVMRSRTGGVKILDFGLARFSARGDSAVAAPAAALVQRRGLAGTPAYMSPEQLNGRDADARSDVFQLGMLVYEYACGEHPFAAATPMATCGRILEATPSPLIARRPDAGALLASVVDRCLQKEPARRFGSATELVGALSVDTSTVRERAPAAWWRTHQLVVIALYVAACAMGWEIKESRHGFATAVFLALGALATIAGVLRGHLVFTERINRTFFRREWQKAAPVLLAIDLLVALLLATDAALMAAGGRPLFAVFTVALGLGIALARAILEPATTQATFPDVVTHARD